jgi:hypothetical protein
LRRAIASRYNFFLLYMQFFICNLWILRIKQFWVFYLLYYFYVIICIVCFDFAAKWNPRASFQAATHFFGIWKELSCSISMICFLICKFFNFAQTSPTVYFFYYWLIVLLNLLKLNWDFSRVLLRWCGLIKFSGCVESFFESQCTLFFC